jgi:hypothetical protein
LQEQRRGAFVLARQAVVSEQVLIAGVQEQLRALDRLGKIAGDVEIALRDKQLIGVHRMDLERDAVRPWTPELRGRDTGVKQQSSLRTWPRLGQHLRAHRPE